MTAITNHAQCAHIWVAQTRETGKSGPLFFEADTIYSYGSHYPIARITDKKTSNGARVVLFNSTSSTKTTESKHKTAVRRALLGTSDRILYVPIVRAVLSDHVRNLAHICEEYESHLLAASRARVYAAHYLERAQRARQDAQEYAQIFELEVPNLPEVDAADIEKARELALRVYEEQRAARVERERERERVKLEEWHERAERWRNGESVSLHTAGLSHIVPTILRVRGDTIETSRGAVVPLSVAPGLWQIANECRKRGKARVLREYRVGDFSLDRVTAMGALVIGCHTLEFPELLRVARLLRLPIPETAEV